MDYEHPHDDDHLHLFGHLHAPSPRFWWGLTALLLAVAVSLVLLRTVFFIDETQYVYVTEFGKPVRLVTRPGLGIKWPYQSLWRFDRRLQMFEPPGREMLTEDKENLNFHWYVCWRIPGEAFVQSQPGPDIEHYVRRFLESVGTVEAAEQRLEERVQAALAAEIGRTRLTQLVSLDEEQVRLQEIEQRVTDALRATAADQFGIEVVDVRLKRFNYPEAVKPAVFAEIRSERERVAVQHRAEGASQKTRVESLATLQRDQLLAQAQREATRIRGEGEAKSMEILNAAHGKNPEFYTLLKTLETYRAILDEQTTVVLSADSPLLKLLSEGLPPLENAPPPTPVTAASSTTGARPGQPQHATSQGSASSGSSQHRASAKRPEVMP